MKTSVKNISRYLGIAATMLLLSLFSGNLFAQKSYHENTLASLSNDFFTNSKEEIMHAIKDIKEVNTEATEETVEDWMLNPEEWESESKLELPAEIEFEEYEMILEDWMMTPNWSDNTVIEEELEIEEWMNQPQNW